MPASAVSPSAARAFFATFRGRASQPERWEKAIRKRALEVARYVLPVTMFCPPVVIAEIWPRLLRV